MVHFMVGDEILRFHKSRNSLWLGSETLFTLLSRIRRSRPSQLSVKIKEDNVLDNPLPSGLLLVAVVWVRSAASGFHPCV